MFNKLTTVLGAKLGLLGKWLKVKNTLAYYDMELFVQINKFIAQVTDVYQTYVQKSMHPM